LFLPYNVDVPMERLPIANWLLIGATVITSASLWFVSASEVVRRGQLLDDEQTRMPAWTDMGIHRGGKLAFSQLLTHTLVHAGIVHLIGNMIFLFCFGNAVNAKIGQLQYLLLYAAMSIAAGVVWLALGRGKVAVGASGAVMGITGVYVVLYPRNYVTVLWRFGMNAGVTEIAGGWVVLCEILFNLLGWLLPFGNVAHEAHLGGMFTGMATGVVLVYTGLVKSTSYEENLLQWLGLQPRTKQRARRRRKRRVQQEE
jgi:membrane associated rhomboid family serine protease